MSGRTPCKALGFLVQKYASANTPNTAQWRERLYFSRASTTLSHYSVITPGYLLSCAKERSRRGAERDPRPLCTDPRPCPSLSPAFSRGPRDMAVFLYF